MDRKHTRHQMRDRYHPNLRAIEMEIRMEEFAITISIARELFEEKARAEYANRCRGRGDSRLRT